MASGNSATGSAIVNPMTVASTNDLWAAAVAQLSEDDQKEIQVQQKDRLTVINEALFEAKQKATQCVAKEWKVTRADGTTLVFRDLFSKIVSWIDRFKQAGDLATSFEPMYAAPAWSAVKILLQVAIGDSQLYTAMLESLETVTNLIARYAIFEEIYLQNASQARNLLVQSITKLYAHILSYLVEAKKYFTQKTARRVVKGIFSQPGFVDDDVNKIRTEQATTEELARLIDAEEIRAKTDDISQLRTMLTDIQQPLMGIRSDLGKISQAQNKDQKLTILRWISTMRYSEHHERVGKRRLKDSGLWFINHHLYVKWRQSRDSCILWLHGIPGSGKSTLMSLVVDSLRENKRSQAVGSVAYVYCLRSPAEPDRADPDEVARSLVRQLACPISSAPVNKVVQQKHDVLSEDGFEPRNLNLDDCEELILGIMRQRPATIVIDALDECAPERRYKLLGLLERVTNSAVHPLKLIVSSRDRGDVTDRMLKLNALTIDTKEGLSDIDLYIQAEVDRSIKERGMLKGNVSEALRSLIVEKLKQGAQGMFLWVSLMIGNLCNAERIQFESDAKEELEKLPQGLNELYANICQRIRTSGSRARRLAETALRWLICSQSPLSSAEFVAIVSLNIVNSSEIMSVSSVLDVCSNLVIHDTDLDIFRLTHLSVREFLETQTEFAANIAHADAARVCLDTLTSPRWLAPATAWSTSALYRYAILYGTTHLARCEKQRRITELAPHIDQFFARDGNLTPYSAKWAKQITDAVKTLSWLDPLKEMVKKFAEEARRGPKTWIFIACVFGYDELVQHACQSLPAITRDLNAQGSTTLHLACEYGHLEIVKMLMHSSVDTDAKDQNRESALTLASARGHTQIVHHLLNHKARQEHDGLRYGSPLQAASFHGHKRIAELLSVDADLEANQGQFGTALQAASFKGHLDVVQLLLGLGADVNAPNRAIVSSFDSMKEDPEDQSSRLEYLSKELARAGAPPGRMVSRPREREIMVDQIQDGALDIGIHQSGLGSAVQVACRGGHTAVVKLLLEHHADIGYEGGVYGHALQAAAVNGSQPIAKLLLGMGVDVDAQSGLYGCALQAACRHNHIPLVKLLLGGGAEVNMHGGHYHTALQAAARTGNAELIQLLLRHNASVNVVGGQYHTALQAAAAYGFTGIVQQLINHNADVNICGGQYHSAIEAAAYGGSVATVELLSTRGAYVFNSLQLAALEGHLEVVRYLLKQGVDVNSSKRVFGTPLLSAISTSRYDIIDLLLDHQADLSTGNYIYGNPLQLAAAAGNTSLVQRLLNNGADPMQFGSSHAAYLVAKESKEPKKVQQDSDHEIRYETRSTASVEDLDHETDTVLESASEARSRSVLDVTSESAASTKRINYNAESALVSAARAGQCDVVKILLENMLTTVRIGHPWKSIQKQMSEIALSIVSNALLSAALNDRPQVISLLLDAYENEEGIYRASALWWACKNGDQRLACRLRDKFRQTIYNGRHLISSPDARQRNMLSDDPLEVAIRNGHGHLVPLLLSSNIEISFFGKPHRALEAACTAGDQRSVRLLIDGGIDVDRAGREAERPLMLASASGHMGIVEMLLGAGANPNFWSIKRGMHLTEWNLTSLHAACAKGHDQVANVLLSHGAYVNVQTQHCPTALFLACQAGHLNIVKTLLQHGANVDAINISSEDATALQVAISKGFYGITKLLLENNADSNIRGGEFGPALKAAAYHGNADILLALINAGADVKFTEREPKSTGYPLMIRPSLPDMKFPRDDESVIYEQQSNTADRWEQGSAHDDHESRKLSDSNYESALEELPSDLEIADARATGRACLSSASWELTLYRNSSGLSVVVSQNMRQALITFSIQSAAFDYYRPRTLWSNNLGVTGRAHRSAVDITSRRASLASVSLYSNVGPGLFVSAIHAAAHSGSHDCVRILIEHGASTSQQDSYGQTPLHQAAARGHLQAIRELLKNGCGINIQDKKGRTALALAAAFGHAETVKELLDHGCSIDLSGSQGSTALQNAAVYGHAAILKQLLRHGAAVSQHDTEDGTPLHTAARENHLDVMKLLIDHGANVGAKDSYGSTPLDYAVQKDNVQAAQYLFKVGAAAELPRSGRTLLHDAATYRSHKVVQWLLKNGHHVNAGPSVKDGGGITPLHLAISAACKAEVSSEGSEFYYRDMAEGDSSAVLNTVSVLLCHGADPMSKSRAGTTPVSLAISKGYCAVMDILVRAGGNVKDHTTKQAPIHHALRSGSCKMLKLVLDHGADVNALDEKGRTAIQVLLDQALDEGELRDSEVALLLHYGARVPSGRFDILFQKVREEMRSKGYEDKFFRDNGFELDGPLYDLSNAE